jgi:hypothetical protein
MILSLFIRFCIIQGILDVVPSPYLPSLFFCEARRRSRAVDS